MSRLDQLAQPQRRNGEHICAILERERRQALELENLSRLSLSRNSPTTNSPNAGNDKRKSRSMTQLSGTKYRKSRDNSRHTSQDRSKESASPSMLLRMKNVDATKSLTQLVSINGDATFSPTSGSSHNNSKKALPSASKHRVLNVTDSGLISLYFTSAKSLFLIDGIFDGGFWCRLYSRFIGLL
jgi:hypothetical protein